MERTIRAAYVNVSDGDNNGMSIRTVIMDRLMIVNREREKQPTCPKVGHQFKKSLGTAYLEYYLLVLLLFIYNFYVFF